MKKQTNLTINGVVIKSYIPSLERGGKRWREVLLWRPAWAESTSCTPAQRPAPTTSKASAYPFRPNSVHKLPKKEAQK